MHVFALAVGIGFFVWFLLMVFWTWSGIRARHQEEMLTRLRSKAPARDADLLVPRVPVFIAQPVVVAPTFSVARTKPMQAPVRVGRGW